MLYMSEEDSVARIDLSGELNRNNIVSIKQGILNRINPSIKAVEFHMENVREMDAPAMAMMVIIVKHLLTKRITSKVWGLTEEYLYLATILGLHLIAEVEAGVEEESKYTKKDKEKGGDTYERRISHGNGGRHRRAPLSVNQGQG